MFFHALTFAGVTVSFGGKSGLLHRVPRKLFEHEAIRLTRGPASANAIKQTCDRYSCISYLIPTQFALKTLLIKH